MKRPSVLLALLIVIKLVSAQTITRPQADSLLKLNHLLGNRNGDTESFLKLANFYSTKSGSLKADIDSANYFINKASTNGPSSNSSRTKGYILLIEGRLENKKGNEKRGKVLVSQALKIGKQSGDKILLGRIYYEQSRYYHNQYDINEMNIRVPLVDTAVKLLKDSPDKIEYIADLQMLADLHYIEQNYKQSLIELKTCLQICDSIHYQRVQGIYILFCKIYNYTGDYRQAVYYGQLAITLSERFDKEGPQLCEIENAVGSTFYYLLELDKSVQHFSRALKIAEKMKDMNIVHDLTVNITATQLKNNQPEKALELLNDVTSRYPSIQEGRIPFATLYIRSYVRLKNLIAAKPYYEKCLALLAHSKITKEDPQQYNIVIVEYLFASGKFSAARPYTTAYANLAELHHVNYQRLQGYKQYYMIDSALHNYQSAFAYIQRYKNLNDSVFNEKLAKQVHELEITYKTKQKDDSIELLNQKSKLQLAGLSKARRNVNESIAGILILLTGGLVFLRQYRIKLSAYRIISDQNELITDKNEEIVYKNRELEGLVQEKEYLVQEIHHRVKNNLHTVLSFLTLQSKYLNGDALSAIKISRQRIYAMSLIHQKLYLSEDVKTIEIKSYLEELITYFQECLEPESNIDFVLDIDHVRLPVSKAIPVGLIVNEAVTNSVKYAFPVKKEGLITIRLKMRDNLIDLLIEDNGIGIAVDANNIDFNSLGIKLIKGLSNDLDAQINFDSAAGTKITILFSAVSS